MPIPKFFKPVECTPYYRGVKVHVHERGLDEQCGEDQNGKVHEGEGHHWLLLPIQDGQKPYMYCMRCGEFSHL